MRDDLIRARGGWISQVRKNDPLRLERPLLGATQGLPGAAALTFLAAGQAKASEGVPDGFVALSGDMGISSYLVLSDGTLELTLSDGAIRLIEAGAFVVTTDGIILIANDLAETLIAAAHAASSLAVVSGLGISAVMAIVGGGSGGGAAGEVEGNGASQGSGGSTTNTPATFSGSLSGTVIEDSAEILRASGIAFVNDPDPSESGWIAQITEGMYGTLDLREGNAWNYQADTTQAEIQELDQGQFLMDTFSVSSIDGTTTTIIITINGVDEPEVAGPIVGAAIPAVELSDIAAGQGGFVINGVSADDRAGHSVSAAGDVNGDGFDDLIVGAFYDDPNGNNTGASFVVFGKTDGTKVELSDVEGGGGGFVINGLPQSFWSGRSVSSAGDVNSDGFDDLIVGARSDLTFVLFGKTDGTAVELSDAMAGRSGFLINGVSAGDQSGGSVSSAGDVNGDGFDDLIVGALADDPNGANSGASFVVFGKTDGSVVELSAVEAGTGGFVINGVSVGDLSGVSVSSAGDVNGDGFDDLIVGAFAADPNGSVSGASFVVFGKTNGTAVELSDVQAGREGFVINGVSAYDQSGWSVSSAGDVNGDGFDDLIVGASGDDPNGSVSGASFVVFGKTDGTAVELSDVEAGQGGFVINGVSAGDSSGGSVSSAADVNGDGFDDLIIGANFDDPNGSSSGASFVVFGKTDGTAVELSDVEKGRGGFVINGVSANDRAGYAVSAAGDVNGDGFDDLIVGARYDDPNGSDSGASFVIFGGDFTGVATQVGTVGDDNMAGTTANDVIFAGVGNDTLGGGGGTDRLSGGAGADIFTLRNLDGTTIILDFDGGEGDLLDVSDFGLTDFAAFEALLTPEGPGGHDTRITFDADTVVILESITPDDLVVSNVML